MNNQRIKQLITGGFATLLLCLNLFVFLGFTLFSANSEELSSSFIQIITAYSLPILFFVGLTALVAFLLPVKLFFGLIAFVSSLTILSWIQGNLLVWDYGLLDGRLIDWNSKSVFGWLELLLWIGGILIAVLTASRSSGALLKFACILAALQLTMLGFGWINQKPTTAGKPNIAASQLAAEKVFRYSPEKNIVHIIADGFQVDIIKEILTTGEQGNLFSKSLSGFTFFEQNLGAFPYTHMSVPAILSGKYYRNHLPIDQYHAESLGGDTILSLAKEAGYEVDMIVEPGALTKIYSQSAPTHLFPLNSRQHISQAETHTYDAAKIFDLALFRSVPHFVKPYVYNDQRWLTQSLILKKEYVGLRNFAHMGFLQESTRQMTANRDTPVYKIFHVMLSHNPMISTRDCRYAGKVLPTARINVLHQARCGLIEVVRLLDRMKEIGIYDNSTIVLMGDHGAWVQPANAKGRINEANNTMEFINPAILALSTPVLAIKPANHNESLRISQAPTSITDVAKSIATLAGFDNQLPGEFVFDLGESQERPRSFMFYEYKRSEWRDNHLEPIHEFRISGDTTDSNFWNYEKTFMPDGSTQIYPDKAVLWLSAPLEDDKP